MDSAKNSKHDEFYTLYEDIEKEISLYYKFNPDVFRGKTILLPCDDPRRSNFTKYFIDNLDKFGIKRLISTCYIPNGKGIVSVCNKDSGPVLHMATLEGDGDFRSLEVKKFFEESDVIVTNPPFSLFRQFLYQVIELKKSFIAIGSLNSLSCKEVFKLVVDGKMWVGHGFGRWISGFIVPQGYDLYGTETFVDKCGNRIISTNGCIWLTNVKHGRMLQPIRLKTMRENIESSKHQKIRSEGYQKYDNINAIEVPYTDAIPSDYEGVMGVPISFLPKHCPEQFEIVGFRKGDDGKDLSIGGRTKFCRVLIRKIKQDKEKSIMTGEPLNT